MAHKQTTRVIVLLALLMALGGSVSGGNPQVSADGGCMVGDR